MAHIDEGKLVAFVDGLLQDDASIQEIEAALRHDTRLRETVQKLRMTPGPLHAAFDTGLHKPPPPELAQTIMDYTLPSSPQTRRLPLSQVAVLCLLVLMVGIGLGYFQTNTLQKLSTQPAAEPWLQAVAEYQVLYGRDTLHQPDANEETIRVTEQRIGLRLGIPVTIPLLDSFGLAFKRGQMLEFEGHPLAQLAYLPKHGRPVAYCIMPSNVQDMAPTAGNMKGLNYYYWHHNGFGYVLIAEMDAERLRKIANTAYGTLLIGSS